MGSANSGVDAVGVYLTGASATGVAQRDHSASLGLYRANTRVQGLSIRRFNALSNVTVDFVSDNNGAGNGSLVATSADTLRWTAPDSTTRGAVVTIANGETKALYDGDDTDKFILVTRTSATDMAGAETVQLMETVNNVIGGTNFTGAESTAGEEKYRAVMFYNQSSASATGVKVWVDGDEDQNVRIAKEAPVSGALTDETSNGEETQPGGLSWSTPTSEGTALDLGTLATSAEYGLWIERSVDPGATAEAEVQTVLHYTFTSGGTQYYGELRGVSRVAEEGLSDYLLYIGDGALPDLSGAADEEFDSGDSPYTTITTFSADKTYYLILAAQNEYGLKTLVEKPEMLYIDDGGDEMYAPPHAPETDSINIRADEDGTLYVQAAYFPGRESTTNTTAETLRATSWVLYITSDGTNPDPDNDTPETEDMSASTRLAGEVLSWTSEDAYLEDTPLKVIPRTRRNDGTDEVPVWTESTNTTVYTTYAEWWGARRPAGLASLGESYGSPEVAWTAPSDDVTYIDEGNNIYWQMNDGKTQLWADTTLIWTIYYDSANESKSGLYTTFTFDRDDISGTGTDDAVEVDTWNGSKILYVCVNGERVMKIDVANTTIYAARMSHTTDITGTASDSPAWRKYAHTCFQVWDHHTGEYKTPVEVTDSGVLVMDVPWRHRDTQGECE